MQETMLLFRQRTKLSMRNQIFIFIFIFFFCCSVKKKDVRSLQTVSVVYALSNFRFLVCAKDSVHVRAACREKNVMLLDACDCIPISKYHMLIYALTSLVTKNTQLALPAVRNYANHRGSLARTVRK